eukprot:c11825_g1_i2.p1 GENE.c11825_g1_i2~~c11825_g1_i2.p1  ORF type:complete len:766 (+),score=152.94 c11825_g1_i2:55-2352(+)
MHVWVTILGLLLGLAAKSTALPTQHSLNNLDIISDPDAVVHAQALLSRVLPANIASQFQFEITVPYRYYLNTCTHSYTMVWWDWDRWEKEIDWMALSGMNMMLAFTGQEYIWDSVFRSQFGMSSDDLDAWFTGPAFLAWGRMGNIRAYGGPLSMEWKQQQFALQQQIMKRLRDLSITAVLPGFAGHVPPAFITKYPSAKITTLPTWAGFNSTFSGDFVLDATDPLFQSIAVAVLKAQEDAYNGTDHVFNADTYNEMVPSSNDPAFLTAQSKAVYDSFAAHDPKAVWMIQGWMFSFDKDFWQPAQIQGYLAGVPDNGMIILDLNAFADPIWKQTSSFYGKPFIWCIINNGGQRPGIYGHLQKIINDTLNAHTQAQSMLGVGIAPEGIYVNYPSYELTIEMGWRKDWVNARDWIRSFATRRYGLVKSDASSTALLTAWDTLLDVAYSTPDAQDGFWISSRPSLSMNPAYSWTNLTAWTQVWRLFHSAAGEFGKVETFRFDYVDILRECMSYFFEDVYRLYLGAMNTNSTTSMQTIGNALTELVDDVDRVLATHHLWTVGEWLQMARQWADVTDHNRELLDYNARHLITVWGPNGELNGYATRHFSGLMRDLYGDRWRLFVSRTTAAVASGTPFDDNEFENDCFNQIEMSWANSHNIYPANELGNTNSVAEEMFQKYLRGNGTVQALITAGYGVFQNSDGSGQMYGNYQSGTRDLGQLDFLCSIDPACGGFIANAYLKPVSVSPIQFPGSTLFVRKQDAPHDQQQIQE